MIFNTSNGGAIEFMSMWQPEYYTYPVPIKLMSDEHILNTIGMLRRKIEAGEEHQHQLGAEGYLQHNIEVFQNELVRRQG